MNAERDTLATRTPRVVVVGQGYVGLPVAMRATEVGFDVVGLDVSEDRIRALRDGRSFVADVSDERLGAALATGHYLPTVNASEAKGFDVAIISVPTPLTDGVPDTSFVVDATRALAEFVRPACCVILESTTYPGTTEELVQPILEERSGLRAESDFSLGYSPERIDPGNATWTFERTPKIVSGVGPRSLAAIEAFFEDLVETTVAVPSPREAELAKLLENTFRHVNIALVNEMAMFAADMGIDIWSTIDAAATKPFGFMRFAPGPGVGGHCLPIDPSYLSWRVHRQLGQTFRFVELATDVNRGMPDYVVQRITLALNARSRPVRGQRLLLAGLAYKRDTADARESPALDVAELLLGLGANVVAADPHVGAADVHPTIERVELTPEEVDRADAVVVLVDHSAFDLAMVAASGAHVLDTRGCLSGPNVERL